MTREQAWRLILEERARQSARWNYQHPWGYGDCSSDTVPEIVKAAVLTEECGEVARAVLDHGASTTRNDQLRNELVQVAAVAVAWLEGIE